MQTESPGITKRTKIPLITKEVFDLGAPPKLPYEKAMNCKIYSSGPDGEFRIDRFVENHGLVHPGYYIVLR